MRRMIDYRFRPQVETRKVGNWLYTGKRNTVNLLREGKVYYSDYIDLNEQTPKDALARMGGKSFVSGKDLAVLRRLFDSLGLQVQP